MNLSPRWCLGAQLDTTSLVADPAPWREELWWFTTSAGARYQRRDLGLGARLYLPLDTFAEDDLRAIGLFVDVLSRF